MGAAVTVLSLLVALVFGPLGWLAWKDRRGERALAVRAEILAALRHTFRGESFLSVQVVPPGLLRPGRVLLSVPSGWEWLIEAAWNTLMEKVPSGYELVLRPGHRGLAEAGVPLPAVKHAA